MRSKIEEMIFLYNKENEVEDNKGDNYQLED